MNAKAMAVWTHPSIATFFMIVSFPEEAAVATCCSILLLIFALSS